MKTIEGVEYVAMTDLAELWGLEHVYSIRNRIYGAIRHGNLFPEPDIQRSTAKRPEGGWGGSSPALWRADRLPELTEWWEKYGQGQRRGATVKTEPEAVPEAAPTEPVVVFTDADITLTIAEDFPKMRESHVLAIVRRGESHKSEHYFITREDAEFILSLFE